MAEACQVVYAGGMRMGKLKHAPPLLVVVVALVAGRAQEQQHWAFVAPKRPAVPTVSKANWVRNPIDAFILSRLDREGTSER